MSAVEQTTLRHSLALQQLKELLWDWHVELDESRGRFAVRIHNERNGTHEATASTLETAIGMAHAGQTRRVA